MEILNSVLETNITKRSVGEFEQRLKQQSSDNSFSSLLRLKTETKEEKMEACYRMEALMVKSMLDSMKKNIQKSGFLDGGNAEKIFSDMLYNEYSLMISRNGGKNSLSHIIYNQITKLK